ncbi:MAG: ABC transporter permease [Actinobacteria bacterium]|nr:MAG: ABC transporter permease [Actinomycetota bacterium]
MTAYLVRRLLHAVLVLAILTLVAFMLIHLVPGDPVRIMLGAHAPPAAVRQVRHELGLDRSLVRQFASFAGGLFRGDLGTSINLQRPVGEVLGPRIGPSILLLLYGTVISLVVAVPLGVLSALYRNRPVDHVIRVLATIGLAMPAFWFGLLLVEIFSLRLHFFPVAGYGDSLFGHLRSLTLPAVTVGVYLAPLVIRTLRSSLNETLAADFITAARARGFEERRVIGKHALRNALIATVTILAINIGYLISGSVVIESVFNIPGLGSLLVSTISVRDFPTISALTLVFGVLVIVVNLLADLSYALIDPRIRL